VRENSQISKFVVRKGKYTPKVNNHAAFHSGIFVNSFT